MHKLNKYLQEREFWYKHRTSKADRLMERNKASGAIEYAKHSGEITQEQQTNAYAWLNEYLPIRKG